MNKYVPDMYIKSIYDININKLKKMGIKNIFFDVDNTLLKYEENIPNKKTIDFINKLKENFNCFLFSNSNNDRIKNISNSFDINAYTSCMKPLKKKYIEVINEYNKEECIFIGDQLMTDVLGAKRNNLKVILVDSLGGVEPLTTRFWRTLERRKLKKLKKNNKFIKGKYYD